MLILMLALTSFASAEDSVTWPHATTVLADDHETDSIAVLVHCFTPKSKYTLEDQTSEMLALGQALAPRIDKVVLMENPTASEVRTELASLVLPDGKLYTNSLLVAAGTGYGGDLGDPRLACRNWDHSVDVTKLPSAADLDVFKAALEVLVKPHDDAEMLTVTELATSMSRLAPVGHAVFDAGQKVVMPDDEMASIGPTASDWKSGQAISAGDSHNYTGRGFISALTSAITSMPNGPITLGALTVATRQNVTDPTITVNTKGDLTKNFLGASVSTVATHDPTIILPTTSSLEQLQHKKGNSAFKPVVRWTGLGVGLAAIGASAYTYSQALELLGTFEDAPANYADEAAANVALGHYLEYRGATYGLWALGGVGLSVSGLTFVIGPHNTSVSGSF